SMSELQSLDLPVSAMGLKNLKALLDALFDPYSSSSSLSSSRSPFHLFFLFVWSLECSYENQCEITYLNYLQSVHQSIHQTKLEFLLHAHPQQQGIQPKEIPWAADEMFQDAGLPAGWVYVPETAPITVEQEPLAPGRIQSDSDFLSMESPKADLSA